MSDDFRKQIDKLQKNVQRISKLDSVSFDELFTSAFMSKYTQFGSIEDMIDASGHRVESAEDFEKIPDDEWDAFVKKVTQFSCWEKMLATAGEQFIGKQLRA